MEQYRNGYKPWKMPQLTCNAPELSGITAYRVPVYFTGSDRPPEISICYERERHFEHITRTIYHISLGHIQNWHYDCLTEWNIPREGFRSSWFDPIRSHPRYLAVAERILKTEGDGSCGARHPEKSK